MMEAAHSRTFGVGAFGVRTLRIYEFLRGKEPGEKNGRQEKGRRGEGCRITGEGIEQQQPAQRNRKGKVPHHIEAVEHHVEHPVDRCLVDGAVVPLDAPLGGSERGVDGLIGRAPHPKLPRHDVFLEADGGPQEMHRSRRHRRCLCVDLRGHVPFAPTLLEALAPLATQRLPTPVRNRLK